MVHDKTSVCTHSVVFWNLTMQCINLCNQLITNTEHWPVVFWNTACFTHCLVLIMSWNISNFAPNGALIWQHFVNLRNGLGIIMISSFWLLLIVKEMLYILFTCLPLSLIINNYNFVFWGHCWKWRLY